MLGNFLEGLKRTKLEIIWRLQVLGLFLLWLCEVKFIWRCCKILRAFWISLPVGFWRRHL